MSARTYVATASRGGPPGEQTHAIVWVSDAGRLASARAALQGLRRLVSDAEEISFKEGPGVGVKASFGDVDLDSLVESEGGDAEEVFEDNHWVELQDPGAPVAGLQETVDENFGSVRVHVREDAFYVTAMLEDEPVESVLIPYL